MDGRIDGGRVDVSKQTKTKSENEAFDVQYSEINLRRSDGTLLREEQLLRSPSRFNVTNGRGREQVA